MFIFSTLFLWDARKLAIQLKFICHPPDLGVEIHPLSHNSSALLYAWGQPSEMSEQISSANMIKTYLTNCSFKKTFYSHYFVGLRIGVQTWPSTQTAEGENWLGNFKRARKGQYQDGQTILSYHRVVRHSQHLELLKSFMVSYKMVHVCISCTSSAIWDWPDRWKYMIWGVGHVSNSVWCAIEYSVIWGHELVCLLHFRTNGYVTRLSLFFLLLSQSIIVSIFFSWRSDAIEVKTWTCYFHLDTSTKQRF